jgi:hypothetical protein
MNDFYRTLQKASYKECNCYVANGVYTPPKNGKIEKYIVYITGWTSNYRAPSKGSINKLIAFANKEFEFDSVIAKEKGHITALVFSGLVVK